MRHKNGGRLAVASLRYFNVIGADPAGRLGPVLTHKEQWDYPRIIDAAMDAALGLRAKLTVMGDAFPTEDGTAVRCARPSRAAPRALPPAARGLRGLAPRSAAELRADVP